MITTKQKHGKGRSVQELIGIMTFTKYGLMTGRGELLFFRVAPTNISVLSHANIEVKIRRLMMVLSALPDIEIVCTDSSECFDDNKAYLTARLEAEDNGRVKKLIKKELKLYIREYQEKKRIILQEKLLNLTDTENISGIV